MVNTCELSNERRYCEQAKGADRLEPTGNVVGTGAEVSPVMGIQHYR